MPDPLSPVLSPRVTVVLHDGRSFTGFVVTDESASPRGLLVIQWSEAVAEPGGSISHVGFEVSLLAAAVRERLPA